MNGRERTPLFWTRDGSAVMRAAISAACEEVDRFPEERVLNTDPEALVAYFQKKYQMVIPTIDRENIEATHHERSLEVRDSWRDRTISVPGEAYDFEIPFDGDAEIFTMRPSTYDTGPPLAEVRGQKLCFTVADRSLSPDRVKQEQDALLASIEKYLGWHRELWMNFDSTLSTEVRQNIERRRTRLLQQKGRAAQLASMGVKLKEKAGDARTFVPPTVKQKLQPQLPPMKSAVPPDPTLDQTQYETILGLIRGAGRSIEQSSSRTRELDEETLRDMFLVPLNAHFGTATGEAFNYQGKTDVLIRHEGKNLFVAEFKIWGGDKHFTATIDQMLSYLSWRDTKTAIVVFSRNAGFSAVVAKIRELAKSHPAYVSGPVKLDETSDRFVFILPQDNERHVTVSILSFDLGTRAA